MIATRNRAARLEALLESLRRQTLGTDRFEVVVVDDGSTDSTFAVLERGEREFPLTAIRMRKGAGPARARNAGWRASQAPVVAFTDDDCEAADSWLEEGLRACAKRPEAIVQGRTEPNPRELDSWGPFTRTVEVKRASPWFQTCNIFYPRRLLECLDGFDESFPAPGGEDTDLAWRAIERGVETDFAPHALVHHAVEDLRPRGHLRVALRWADAMGMFRHEGLRRQALIGGVVWKWSHVILPLALLGLVMSRRAKPALGLVLPYVRHLRGVSRNRGTSMALAPYFALHDLVEVYGTVRGSARRGLLVI